MARGSNSKALRNENTKSTKIPNIGRMFADESQVSTTGKRPNSLTEDNYSSMEIGMGSLDIAQLIITQTATKPEQDAQVYDVMNSLSNATQTIATQFQNLSSDPEAFNQFAPTLKAYKSIFASLKKSMNAFSAAYEAQEREKRGSTISIARRASLTPLMTLITRLVTEEANYIYGLEQIVNFFQTRLREEELISGTDESTIFSCCDAILAAHHPLMEDLKAILRDPKVGQVGEIFLKHRDAFNIYKAFIVNVKEAQSCLERISKEKGVSNFMKANAKSGHTLPELLQLPMRRIEDYVFIFTEIYKVESTFSSGASIGEARDMFHDLLDTIDSEGSVADNLAMAMEIGNKIEGLDENLVRPDRRFIHESSVKIFPHATKKAIAEYAYLFNDVLLFCQSSGKTHSYVGRFYIHRLQYSDPVDDSKTILLTIDGSNKFDMVTNDDSSCREWILHLNKVICEVERTRKVFGVPLNVLMKRETESTIPTIVEKTIHFIYEYGMNKEGIFRQTGRSTQIESLKDQLNQGSKVFFSENMDVHSVAALFKLWLRELPEPLLTWEAYDKFMQVAEIPKEERAAPLKEALQSIPSHNQAVVHHMFKCLRAICDNEEKSKMNPGNLAVVFAPNILKNPDPDADPFDQSYYQNINIVFTAMLDNFAEISSPDDIVLVRRKKSRKGKDSERKKSLRMNAAISTANASSCEGQVFVQIKKKWHPRLVILEQDSVTIRKNAKDKKPKNYELSSNTNAIPETACEKPFAFSFFVNDAGGSTKILMAAKTSDQQAEWIEALQNALAMMSTAAM